MKHIKSFEAAEIKLKKYIEINILNLIIICYVIIESESYIRIRKLYTYNKSSNTLSKTNELPTNLIYDNFTKETIGNQSNNIEELLKPLKLKQDINKFNL